MDTDITIPQEKIKRLCHRYQVKRLAFFGSVLRQDFNPESDIDILVQFHPDAKIGFMTLGRLGRDLSQILKRPVDLVPQEGLKPIIREEILSTAHEIYAS